MGNQGYLYGSPLEEDVTARFGMDLTSRKGCSSEMIRVNFHYVGGLLVTAWWLRLLFGMKIEFASLDCISGELHGKWTERVQCSIALFTQPQQSRLSRYNF